MLDILKSTLNRNLLRHAVGRQMFCGRCESVLDFRRAALLTVSSPDGQSSSCRIYCWNCIDEAEAFAKAIIAEKRPTFKLEILKGYKGKPKPAPTANEIYAKEMAKGERMAKAYDDKVSGRLFGKQRGFILIK